ncbi:hybrid sensor histidine kinase/response regulator [Aphanothece hegewaldii CCALA 016]|uniref:histidine kinase n=1 Tax=Aphanothece hegewaldii CCALA 016 TaxID=2107694 RepID=A0A2T1LZU9_9CHRO|nr:hybrid sensor histidine kinase/response regulator [Aphanothece hegewaldii]PSF37949.1 hybrid sensor histidine kinase/response regulator [Aphanothece hegewaldii CCALA 016]
MKEQDIKRQFLDEAGDYLNVIESALLGCSTKEITSAQFDAVLRAAHSIKGGAAMMGYQTLSDFAHRLEDFFKVLKSHSKPEIDETVESLFLSSVDQLRQISSFYRQGAETIAPEWLSEQVEPIFQGLLDRIGELTPEKSLSLLSEDVGEEMTVLIFETEVESCLQGLESIIAQPQPTNLREEILSISQELGGLGEMLQLPQFSRLCTSIYEHLKSATEGIDAIALSAIQAWRRAQAMVIVGQKEAITSEFLLNHSTVIPTLETETTSPEELKIETVSTEEKTLRVSSSLLTELADLFGEMSIGRNSMDLQLQRLRRLFNLLNQRIQRLESSSQALRSLYDQRIQGYTSSVIPIKTNSVKPHLALFDNLEMDNYSDLHPLSQEVMETIFQIEEVANDLDIYLAETEKTAKDSQQTFELIQSQLTKARMRPLTDLIAHFPRALRDMSLKYGKPVELKIQGETTRIDRTILESLNDPLLHLLRNAFDHGIEDPEKRKEVGKPPQGTITISASTVRNHTIIQIQDDGAGINLDKIRSQAHKMGLDEDIIAKATIDDLLNLIFEPGFSTAENKSELSGRGVGMDIVKTQVQQMQGDIKVSTLAGQGTTFTITVPMTLSLIRVLLIEVEQMLMAVPCNAIEAMILPEPSQIIQFKGQTFLKEESELFPLIYLKDWLNIPTVYTQRDHESLPSIDKPTILKIALGNNYIGLWVERYWGEQEVTIRPVEGNLKLPNGFTGCTILGDGCVVPLIDPALLLQPSFPPSFLSSSFISNSQPTAQKATLLVIDDSINVRRLLALTLEKAGYQVEQAKDGQDALEKLQRGLGVQGIICDIEMPRLDGYGFLANYKTDSIGQNIPVVMLTSRSGEKHRSIAMNLGASAYFSKPFQEKLLLQTLQSLIKN